LTAGQNTWGDEQMVETGDPKSNDARRLGWRDVGAAPVQVGIRMSAG
jgi:hypothetical protein